MLYLPGPAVGNAVGIAVIRGRSPSGTHVQLAGPDLGPGQSLNEEDLEQGRHFISAREYQQSCQSFGPEVVPTGARARARAAPIIPAHITPPCTASSALCLNSLKIFL